MEYFKIAKWKEYQHYKDRRPPWIKLYNKLLRKYEFLCLQDDSKLLLILLWLYASTIETKNNEEPVIPYDPYFLKSIIPVNNVPDLQPLIDKGFIIMLAGCNQDDSDLSQSRRTETETETEIYTSSKKDDFSLETIKAQGSLIGLTESECESFYHHFNAQGWNRGNGQPIKNLHSALTYWRNNGHKFNTKAPEDAKAEILRKAKEYASE